MTDMERLNRNKEGIIQTLRLRGPSLPVLIAKAIEVQPLFASAFLSELKAEKRVKISNMRVGSSPIYFLPGQEEQLENFIQHLNNREREAFSLLKKEKILEDKTQTPVIRVALREIKDFATPLNIKIGEEKKLFWKFSIIENAEATELIKKNLRDFKVPKEKLVEEKPAIEQKPIEQKSTIPSQKEAQEKPLQENPVEAKQKPIPKKKPIEEKPLEQKSIKPVEENPPQIKKPKTVETEFSKNTKDYLKGKDIELLEIITEKKREFEAKIRIDTMFGKQEFYLVAKDKKNVTDNDLTIATQKAQQEKMPAAFFSPGDLNNKGKEHLKNWNNLVKFEKLNF